MLFPEAKLSREEILRSVARAFKENGTAIFLDASVLIHCYEMSVGARDELLEALDKFGEQVKVPLWAARETWEWSINKIDKFPLQRLAAKLKDHIALFTTEARRYVDDDTTPDLNKSEYETQLQAAATTLLRLSDLVAKHQRRPEQTSEIVMPFIEKRRLNSDLASVATRVSKDAEFRIAHRIPPGFGDGKPNEDDVEKTDTSDPVAKGKKRNRYGDQIIWQEILDATEEMKCSGLVFITQDTQKGDWVYKPKRVRDDNGRLQDNVGTLTLAHPMLVQEALRRCPDLKEVHIISVPMFALVLRNHLSQPVGKLVAALQTDDDLGLRQRRVRRRSSEGSIRMPEVAFDPSEEVAFRSTDLTYEPNLESPIDQLIAQLGVEDWEVQNRAAQQLDSILHNANRDQLVQIGRAVANAANKSATEPLEFLKRIAIQERTVERVYPNVLVGALASIYLNDSGDPKKPASSSELIDLVFRAQKDERFVGAFEAVIGRLTAQKRAYIVLPMEDASVLTIGFGLDRGGATPVLRSATIAETELIEEAAPESRRFSGSGKEELATIDSVRLRIATEFAIPPNMLSTDQSPQLQVLIPSDTGFLRWGPGTGVTLR